MKQFHLFIRLMTDKRINAFPKAIILLALIYLIIFPDLFPGPVDDAGVLGAAMLIFIALVPKEIIEEHKRLVA